ncbi:EfeM/EfeO family lipoprotein [Streptomyces sp. NPDC046931]|uniref:EfeM/EfeO family lipoprotein n=1 Tax=Streptomyces sp. NPDC046931 TaxID=3154806 RepID=UPI0033F58A74
MPVPGLGSRPARLLAAGGVLLVLALVTALLVTTLAPGRRTRAFADGLPHTTVEVSPGGCGRGWNRPVPGLQVFELHNTSGGAAEVYLQNTRTRAVYAELEGLGPGTTRPLTVRLGAGAYAFTCLPDDASAVTGPTVRIAAGTPGPAAPPVTEHDLIPLAIDYQSWAAHGLDEVVRLTVRLRDDVDRGDLDGARRDWLPAHLAYERLGGAYDAFGDADGRINGTDAGLPGGVDDPSFTGFHRIEYGLWHGQSAERLRGPAGALVTAARSLRADWAQTRMDPAQLGLRAHEILENTVQFELTGRTDYGSGSNLATARAGLDGTRAVLSRLRPLLVTRDPGLPALERELDRADRTVDGFRHGGHWTPLDRLDRAPREQLDAVLGDLVERLAPVATLCDPRRTV